MFEYWETYTVSFCRSYDEDELKALANRYDNYLKFIESPYFWIMMVTGLIFVALIYIKHLGNIKRLLTGTERKITDKKTE